MRAFLAGRGQLGWLVTSLLLILPAVALAGPKIRVPASYTLADQRVGVASAPQNLTVHNDGDAPLHISTIALTGTNAADFLASTTAPLTVAANGSTNVQFTFKPGGMGPRSATIELSSDDTMTPVARTDLSGNGVVAGFMASPSMLSFDKTRTGTCSAAQLIKISNSGTDDLHVTQIKFDGPQKGSFRTASLPLTVPAGAAAYIDVSLCPVDIGSISATLLINTDYMPGHQAMIPLSGSAFGPVIQVSPAQIDFGEVYAGSTKAVTVTISNPGDDATTLAGVTVGGNDAVHFSATGPAAGTTLGAKAMLSFDVTARPVDATPLSAEVVIGLNEDLAPGKAVHVPLTATGIVTTVSLTPASPAGIDCGTHYVGTTSPCQMTVAIKNTGTRGLEGLLASTSNGNAMDFLLDGVPATLAPMQAAQAKISFRPSGGGIRSTTLVVHAKGLTGQPQVGLGGRGQAAALSFNPSTLDFGSVDVGQMPITLPLTLINQGETDLAIDLLVVPGPDSMDPADAGVTAQFALDQHSVALSSGDTQQVNLTFTPAVVGMTVAQLGLYFSGTMAPIDAVDITARVRQAPQPGSGCQMSGRGEQAAPVSAAFGAWALGLVAIRVRRKRACVHGFPTRG